MWFQPEDISKYCLQNSRHSIQMLVKEVPQSDILKTKFPETHHYAHYMEFQSIKYHFWYNGIIFLL